MATTQKSLSNVFLYVFLTLSQVQLQTRDASSSSLGHASSSRALAGGKVQASVKMVTVVFGNSAVVFGNSTVVFGNSAVVFGNWNGCIRKLGFGNCAVVFGNWYSETQAVVFGNWKGGIRKLHGCIWKLVFGNYTVVFGNWYSETETVVFGNSTVVFGNSYSETRRLYSETAGPESLSSACISMAMPGKLL